MEICKNCGSGLVEKATKRTASQLKKPFYYTAYYYCPHCKKMYHDEKFKVYNNQTSLLSPSPVILSNAKNLKDPSSSTQDDTLKEVSIWTDGACIHNGTPKAKAAWAFVSGKIEEAGLVEGKQTNNMAEGLAIYHALLWAAEKGHKKIKLHTDSQISLFNLNKHHSLVKVNREIFENIANVIEKYDLQIDFIKVLGHSGEVNNERVDKLANDLARKAK